jgi:hypothetical protein
MALGDQRGVPSSTVLLVESDQLAVPRDPGGATGLGEEHQRQQPHHLTVLGYELTEQSREADGLGGQVVTHRVTVGAARQIALVEDQIEDGEHAGDSSRQVNRGRHPVGTRPALIFAFARVIRCPMVASCTEEREHEEERECVQLAGAQVGLDLRADLALGPRRPADCDPDASQRRNGVVHPT